MEGKLVAVAEYLSYEEGILLFNALQDEGIISIVNTCGPPAVPFGDGLYFKLLVPEEDFIKAAALTAAFKLAVTEARQVIRCPRCRSEAVLEAENLPFWQKLYYAGTQVFRCENCGKKFAR